jgi:anti-sigma factor RsiW
MSQTDHDTFRELSALRLYDELEPAEQARLERHLAACASCAAHAHELAAGLGRLARGAFADDLPGDWRERLSEGLGAERRQGALRSPLWVAAASFLAGATLAWTVAVPAAGGGGAAPGARLGPPAEALAGAFERATPPPRARDHGMLPLLELYLRR